MCCKCILISISYYVHFMQLKKTESILLKNCTVITKHPVYIYILKFYFTYPFKTNCYKFYIKSQLKFCGIVEKNSRKILTKDTVLDVIIKQASFENFYTRTNYKKTFKSLDLKCIKKCL